MPHSLPRGLALTMMERTGVAAFVLAALFLSACETEQKRPETKSYALTITAGEHGTVNPTGGTYKEGTVVNLTAIPDAGHRVLSWTGTDNDASTATTNAVTMTGNKSVAAAFISLAREEFERTESAANWVFGNGPEFPGARGSFNIAAGRGRSNSKGGVLAFDFSAGGAYVIAAQAFASPVPLQGISFWLSGFVAGTRLIVRLTDESGMTFQYFPTVGAADAWVQVRVLLGDWDSSWGGAADGVFHGGLKAIGIGVDKGLQYYKTGDFAIDDIAEMTSAEMSFDPFGLDRLPEFYTGPVSALIGVNIHFIRPDMNLLDLAKRAGFGFVRMDLFWPTVDLGASRYDFSEYAPLLQALEERGLGAYFIMAYANPQYYDGPGGFIEHWGPQTAATQAAYARYVLAAAKHLSGRNVTLEIWNEPNIVQFWEPAPDPLIYGQLAAETLKAVKTEVSNVPIVIGATSLCDAPFIGRMLDVPGLTGVDAVCIHPYRTIAPETFVPERVLVQDVVRKKTGRSDVPLYSGEWGYSSTLFGGRSDAAWKKQALYAIRMILINIRTGVPKTVYYDLKDDGSDPQNVEHNYGLLTEGATAKPAYDAIKTLYDLLPGKGSGAAAGEGGGANGSGHEGADSWAVSGVETRANDVFGLVFRNAGGELAALWTSRTRAAAEVKIPDDASYKFYNIFGGAVLPTKREGGFCTIALDGENGPVYVRK